MPKRDLENLQTLHRFLKLDTNKDKELQELTKLVSDLLHCPMAMITLMDGQRQIYLYKVGRSKEIFILPLPGKRA